MEQSSRFSQMNSISSSEIASGYFNTRCLRLRRCCSALCLIRPISVEPVVFLYVFSAYLYIGTFELYAFNWNGWEELKSSKNISNESWEECVTVKELNAYGRYGNTTASRVQSDVAILNLFVGVASQIPGIISALILGPFSDKYGRKNAMGVVIVGLILQSLLSNLIIDFKLNLHYFILSSALRSLMGGLAGLLTISHSYIADISSKKWLTLRLGVLECMWFIGSSLGLGIVGVWLQFTNCHFLPVSLLMLATSAVLIPYLIFFVRESLNHQQTIERRRLLTTGPKSLLVGFKIFFTRSHLLWKLWFSLATLCITVINQIGTLTIITLFLLYEPLEWSPALIGVYLVAGELIRGFSLIVILPLMVACSLPDPVIALLGVSVACVTSVGMGFISQTWQMFLAGSVQGVDAIITPALKAMMSKYVPPQEQGALFSLVSAVQVLSGAAAFILYSLAYKTSLNMGWGAGTPFWLMAILYTISIPLLIALVVFSKRSARHQLGTNNAGGGSSTSGIPQQPGSPTSIQSPQQHSNDDFGSAQWVLSKTEAQRCPHAFKSPSLGLDESEKQSLLSPSRGSNFGYYSASLTVSH